MQDNYTSPAGLLSGADLIQICNGPQSDSCLHLLLIIPFNTPVVFATLPVSDMSLGDIRKK